MNTTTTRRPRTIAPAALAELRAAWHAEPPDLARLRRAQAPIVAAGFCPTCAIDDGPPAELGEFEPGDRWNRAGRECCLCGDFFQTADEYETEDYGGAMDAAGGIVSDADPGL